MYNLQFFSHLLTHLAVSSRAVYADIYFLLRKLGGVVIEAIHAKRNQFRHKVFTGAIFDIANWNMNEQNSYDFVFVYSPRRMVRMVAVVILQS